MYYGARYYDPRTSVWQSPDPILDSYLNGKPNDGVLNSFNLSLYTYTAQNPVKYIDPDGNQRVRPTWQQVMIVRSVAGKVANADGPLPIADGFIALWFASAVIVDVGYIIDRALTPEKRIKVNLKLGEIAKNAVMEGLDQKAKAQKSRKKRRPRRKHGSYTITFKSGKKYHGKGNLARMNLSAKEKEARYGDKATLYHWTGARTEREAFKQESRRLEKDGWHKKRNRSGQKVDNPNNYNKIDSPGTRYRKQDGEKIRNHPDQK